MVKNALIAGATGLVGGELVSLLVKTDYYNSIHVLSRRPYSFEHPKIHSYSVNFDNVHSFKAEALIRDVYVCLGTTLKKAGSVENFRKVDFHYVLELAKWAKENKVQRFSVISSIGANKTKKNYYLQTKGEMEEELQSLGFEHLVILRPSLLLGERNETRIAEQFGKYFMKVFSPLLIGNLKNYKPVKATEVANTMFISTINSDQLVRVIENDKIVTGDKS
jgi:uncharacterized protein YbjT (DUF2867 family)